jgi:hypothetical protein
MINFPSTFGQPTNGTFTHTEAGQTWAWNGVTWKTAGGPGYVLKAGDTMTGNLSVPNATASAHAVNLTTYTATGILGTSPTSVAFKAKPGQFFGGTTGMAALRADVVTANSTGDATIFFSPAFVTTPKVVLTTQAAGQDNWVVVARLTSVSTSSVSLRVNSWDGSGTGAAQGGGATVYFHAYGEIS